MKPKTINLANLTPDERARVDRALAPRRDTMVSNRHPAASVARWKAAARACGESLTEWVERHLDIAAKERS